MNRQRLMVGGIALMLMLGVVWLFSGPDDGIEEGKVYELAYSYKVNVKKMNKGCCYEGRVFDFADRNLPEKSILVPLQDDRGVSLVTRDPTLRPSTVKKIRRQVAAQTVESVYYPGYEYVEWRYNFGHTEVQNHVPVVTPAQ